MGSGCAKIFSTDDDKMVIEPIKSSMKPTLSLVITKQDSQDLFQQNYEIGPYFLKEDDYSSKVSIQMEKWLSFIEEGSRIKKIRNVPDNYFDTETQKILFSLSKSQRKDITQFLNENTITTSRWSLWKVIMFPEYLYDQHLYGLLKQQTVKKKQLETIIKDLHRTFPYMKYFNQDQSDQIEQGQQTLFRLLKAISIYFPAVGYTQGMSFLVGLLLIVSGGLEEETFWCFVYLGKHPKFQILGLFEDGFPLIVFQLYIFDRVLEKHDKKLYDFIKDLQLPQFSLFYQWFTSLFIYSFPLEYVVKIWDLVISRSLFFCIQVAVSILIQLKQQIYNSEDKMDFISIFQDIKENIDGKYDQNKENLLIALKNSKKIQLINTQIQTYAAEFQKMQLKIEKEDNIKINHFYTDYYKQYDKFLKEGDFFNQALIPSQNQNNIG